MEKTVYYEQRQEGYRKILEEIKTNEKGRSDFENAITEHIYRWWQTGSPIMKAGSSVPTAFTLKTRSSTPSARSLRSTATTALP